MPWFESLVSAYDRYGQKRGKGRVRGEGEKSIEGEKRKNEEVIYVEGEKRNMVGLNLEMQGEGVAHGAKPMMWERTVVVEREKAIGGSAIGHDMISKQVFVPKYSSSVNDLSWANKGVVVSVVNGEVIPVIQRRIFDVGFDKLVIIPLGADKVFLRSLDDSDVSILFSQAPEFFDNFFSRPVRWSKDVSIRERGAWVHIYGVSLHAWNNDFFKLCVMDCGHLLKIDDITLERDRFDYARILLSITSLEVINTEAQIMVDGVLFDLRVIEEWGYSLGEDACLLDEEQDLDEVSIEMPEVLGEDIGGDDVDVFVNHLSEKLKEDAVPKQRQYPSPVVLKPIATVRVNSSPSVASKLQGIEPSLLSPIFASKNASMEAQSQEGSHPPNQDVSAEVGTKVSNLFTVNRRVVKRTSSCPPTRARPQASCPWSLEWANRHKRSESEVNVKPSLKGSAKPISKGPSRVLKKKGSGHLRHCAQNLKRITRLSDKDRQEVLRALQRTMKQRRTVSKASKVKVMSNDSTSVSQSSINNDWKHWLVLHGDEKAVNQDVCDIAHIVGLMFQGDNNNMFYVLSGMGRKNNRDAENGK